MYIKFSVIHLFVRGNPGWFQTIACGLSNEESVAKKTDMTVEGLFRL